MRKKIRKILDEKQSKGKPESVIPIEVKKSYQEIRKLKMPIPKFNRSVLRTSYINNRKILELNCGHMVEDKTGSLVSPTKVHCSLCVNEFLQKELKKINDMYSKISKF